MMRSLFSGVSGLKNHQTRMDVIGNNIANVNTAGFKGSRVTFQDMLSQSMSAASSPQGGRGGTNPQQVGLGMGLSSIDTYFGNGNVQSTGKNTDLCISDSGFFIVADGNTKYYTRAGGFEFDTQGNYTIPGSGLRVQGWMADALGNINTSGQPTNIVVPTGQTMPAKASDSVTFSKNLSAEGTVRMKTVEKTTVVAGVAAGAQPVVGFVDPVNGVVTSVVEVPNPAPPGPSTFTVTYVKTTKVPALPTDVVGPPNAAGEEIKKIDEAYVKNGEITAYDSQGVEHKISVNFKKTGANQWTVEPAKADTSTGYPLNAFSYVIEFNADGSFKSVSNTNPITFSPPQADPVSLAIDFSGLTQYSGETTATVTDYTGYPAGALQSVSIDKTGTIIGKFTNNLTKSLGQVALATFNNPSGLTKSGNSLYSESNNSGIPQVSTANNGGAGSITPSSLEMSNVDLSDEFSNMIITQRGFQSNSKIITVSDEMLDTLIGMKR